jgi:predicted PurR-regulated permease PerM
MHAEAVSGMETNQEAASSSPPRAAALPDKRFDIRSVALCGLFVLAVLYTTYFIRAVLLPLVLALMLSYLLRPITRLFGRIGIPALLSAALVLVSLLGVVGYGIFSLTAPAASWLEKAPYSFQQLEGKLYPLKKPMRDMAKASGEIEKLAMPDSSPAKATVEVKKHPRASRARIAEQRRSPLHPSFFPTGV